MSALGQTLFDVRTELSEANKEIGQLKYINSSLHVTIADLNQRINKLQLFKDTTHNMLNGMQVPQFETFDCRLRERLKWVAKKLKECFID